MALRNGYVALQGKNAKYEHIAIAERALGKPLPRGAIVHHANEDRTDNRPKNLVICPDVAYHNLIHKRMRALAATGNANALICRFCKKYEAPEKLAVYQWRNKTIAMHKECSAKESLSRYHARKEK